MSDIVDSEAQQSPEAPEQMHEQLLGIYNSVPVAWGIGFDFDQPDAGRKIGELFQRRMDSELRAQLAEKLFKLLSKSELPGGAQDYLNGKFEEYYIGGRMPEGRITGGAQGIFDIALNVAESYPGGIFSKEGAKKANRDLYEEADWELSMLEDPDAVETSDNFYRVELEQKRKNLEKWKNESIEKFKDPVHFSQN